MREYRRLDAWINGAAMRDISGRLHIVNITEEAPDQELTWADIPGRSGQRLMERVRRNKRVTIEFDIRELYRLADRASIVDAVNAWARDGVLEVSYRPQQRLRVVLAKAAEFGGARDVTDSYTLHLDAAASPYWESKDALEITASGTGGSGELIVPGSAQARPEIYVTPTGGTLNTLRLDFGLASMSFTDLGVAANTTLAITHDDRGVLVIADPIASKLNKRSADSADDFILSPGFALASFAANVACDVKFAVRGCFL